MGPPAPNWPTRDRSRPLGRTHVSGASARGWLSHVAVDAEDEAVPDKRQLRCPGETPDRNRIEPRDLQAGTADAPVIGREALTVQTQVLPRSWRDKRTASHGSHRRDRVQP